ncbi:7946_t:CDS:2, partial [Dentiscutata erythropus]
HINHSIQITIFSSNTTTIFESDTKQQFYQSFEVSIKITNIYFSILITKSSFSSNSTNYLETGFHTPTLTPSYLFEKQEQIRPSTPETIINIEQENLFNNDNNQ